MTIKFEPRDLWIGIFWKRVARLTTLRTDRNIYEVYVCIVPMFPILFRIERPIPRSKRHLNW